VPRIEPTYVQDGAVPAISASGATFRLAAMRTGYLPAESVSQASLERGDING
jgi:hypothetical protein